VESEKTLQCGCGRAIAESCRWDQIGVWQADSCAPRDVAEAAEKDLARRLLRLLKHLLSTCRDFLRIVMIYREYSPVVHLGRLMTSLQIDGLRVKPFERRRDGGTAATGGNP
jgi:hypothetical protein